MSEQLENIRNKATIVEGNSTGDDLLWRVVILMLSWLENGNKKRKATHDDPKGKRKAPKIVDPEISLEEESDMDQNVRNLLQDHEGTSKSEDNDEYNEIDNMLLALSSDVGKQEKKEPPVKDNLAKCINDI